MNFIYGAGEIGRKAFEYLSGKGIDIDSFIVSKKSIPEEIGGVKVISIDDMLKLYSGKNHSKFSLYVAMAEKYWDEIRENINELKNTFPKGEVVWLTAEDILRIQRENNPVNADSFIKDTKPVSTMFGLDRGTPIDRYYIKRFLQNHSVNITKHQKIMEVGCDYGYGKSLFKIDDTEHAILDYSKGMDLTDCTTLPRAQYDVFICTQVFNFIYDVKAAVEGSYYLLKPGGTLLATVAGNISQVSSYDMERWGDYWRFTTLGIKKIVSEVFGENIIIQGYGNAMAATAFIQGLAVEDVEIKLLDKVDDNYSIVIGIHATKTV